ncbi:phosphatase PAP2 family protein [Nocardia sp. NPDC003345]
MSIAPGAPDPLPADRPAGPARCPGGRPDPHHRSRAHTAVPAGHRAVPPPDLPRAEAGRSPGTLSTVAVTTAGAAVTAAIPLTFPPGGGPTSLDLAVSSRIHPRLDPRPWLAEVLALASSTGVVLVLLCAAVALFAWQRKWWEAVTVVLVPEIAVAINTWALKPGWGRPLHDYLAYPSGHTVHLVSLVTTVVLLLRSVRARLALVALAVLALGLGSVGMIALDYHEATDIAGGAAAGIALAAALFWTAGRARRALGNRPH